MPTMRVLFSEDASVSLASVYVKETLQKGQRMLIDEERDGVQRECAYQRDEEAPIERPPAAFPVDFLGAIAPASVARVTEAVHLDPTLDHVYRQVVPRYHTRSATGK